MKEEILLKKIQENPFFLAPMAGVTDSPFRSFMREMGAGILTTELVSVKALQNPYNRSRQLMAFEESQRPVGVQIFGEDPQALGTGAKIAESTGCDFIDLNFGCPVAKITKKGAGAATLKDLKFLRQVLRSVKQAVSLPVSIKVRTGWDQDSRNTAQVVQIAFDEGIVWVSLHGRTRAQAYSGHSDWGYIAEVKQQSPLPLIGNGDLVNGDQILKLKKQSGCDGMMIGRGCLKNPWIFQDTKADWLSGGSSKKNNLLCISDSLVSSSRKLPQVPVKGQSVISQQTGLKSGTGESVVTGKGRSFGKVLNRLKFYLENFYEEERLFLLQYKKFCAWYSSGHPGSADFRRTVFQLKNKDEVVDFIHQYFHRVELEARQNIPYEASLMQGHG